MTFSIVAQSGDAFGVAVASRFPAVGSVVPGARIRLGAVATQAMARVSYREAALDTLAGGGDAAAAVEACTSPDAEREHRQLGVVGASSQASFTGSECMPWAGGRTGRDADGGYAIQGNILAGPQVVEEMKRSWDASAGQPLARRLLTALAAGDLAGGDRRGRQSAALLVVREGAGYGGLDDVAVDLRVDDHPQPIEELARLLDLNDLYLTASTEQEQVEVTEGLRAELEAFARAHGHPDFNAWVGAENYEMRVADDGSWVDQRVLAIVRAARPDDTT